VLESHLKMKKSVPARLNVRVITLPDAAGIHVALFFANLAWNECVGLGAERERTKNIWQAIEAEKAEGGRMRDEG